MRLTSLEQSLLAFGTDGAGSLLSGLAQQLNHIEVSSRELTSTGFFTNLRLLHENPRVKARDFEISDVEGTAEELEHGFGCLIFVKNGQLDTIEVFTYGEKWPDKISDVKLHYSDAPERNFDKFMI